MKEIFVIFRSGISGGTATLSMRIGECLVCKGYEVIYICQIINDENNVRSMEDKGIKVYQWKLKDAGRKLSEYYRDCKLNVLTYSLNEFIFIESLKNRININKNVLYIVHHYGLVKGKDKKYIFIKSINKFYLKIIETYLNNNNIIFMDQISINETEKFYKFKIHNAQDLIFNLPIQVERLNLDKIEQKCKLETFNILTIARADFPFKGYIMGLIDDFRKLCTTYDDIKLTIITFGKNEVEVHKKIKELPYTIQKKINIIGQTPYEKLNEYFEKTHIYLGMGTTLLDAVNQGVPSLAMQQYTYNNYSSGFFSTQPNFLVGYPNIDLSACIYIEKVKKMSVSDYRELCIKEHKALLEHYNIDSVIRFLQRDNKTADMKFITHMQILMYRFLEQILLIFKCLKQITKG